MACMLCNSGTPERHGMHILNIPNSRAGAPVSQETFHAAATPSLWYCASILFIHHKVSGVQRS